MQPITVRLTHNELEMLHSKMEEYSENLSVVVRRAIRNYCSEC